VVVVSWDHIIMIVAEINLLVLRPKRRKTYSTGVTHIVVVVVVQRKDMEHHSNSSTNNNNVEQSMGERDTNI